MITIYCYDIAAGELTQPTMEELPEIFEEGNVDLWVDLESPTREEADILRNVFHFHELAIEDCIAGEVEEAKIDDYEDYLFMVLHAVFFERSSLSFDISELDLFFGRNYVVTHHKRPTVGIKQLKKRLDNAIDFMAEGTDEILHAVVDALVDNYTRSFKIIERTIFNLETEILGDPKQKTFNNLFRLKRNLINLRRIFVPTEETIEGLAESDHELIQEENRVYFHDIHDHMSVIQGLLNSYLEMVTGTMDTYMTIANHRMTDVMKVLTIISTIMLPPTLIASLLGMNVPIPFQHSDFGFIIILGLCGIFAGAMLWYFKRQDWL